MKKINKRDAERILSYLEKAKLIINQNRERSDDREIFMDEDIAQECIDCVSEILIAINNTVL